MIDIFPPDPEGSIRVAEDASVIELARILLDKSFDKFMELYFFSTGYNFSFVSPPPGQEKQHLVNGSWQGHLGLLQRKEADLIPTSLPVSQERLLAADFIYTYEPMLYKIVSKSIRKMEVEDILGEFWNTELKVWMCMLATYIFMPIFIEMGAIAMTAVSWRWKRKSDGEIYSRVMWRTMSQGSGKTLSFHSCRFSLLLLLIYAFLMSNWLSAFLHTSLVIKRDGHQIDSLDDAISRKNLKIILVNRQNMAQYFKESTTEEYYKVWRYIEEGKIELFSDFMSNINQILKQLSLGKTALIIDNHSYLVINFLMCNVDPTVKFHLGQVPVAQITEGIAVSKSLEVIKFRKDYEAHYKNLFQSGLVQHLLMGLSPSHPQCYLALSNDDLNAAIALHMSSLKFTFWCWIIGVCIASMCCILEKAIADAVLRGRKLG